MLGLLGALFLMRLFSPEPAGSGRNAAADAVVQYSGELGIVFDGESSDASPPKLTDFDSFRQMGLSAWLKSQVEHESDEITEPPATLRKYLIDHAISIARLASGLEKQDPDWGKKIDGDLPVSISGPTELLEKVLLAAVLMNEHEGNLVDAERALEASWSLTRPIAATTTIWSQSQASDIQKLQAGVLRKVKNPSGRWQRRLAERTPWEGVLEALPTAGDSTDDEQQQFLRSVADSVRVAGPCELAAMSDGELWKPAKVEFADRDSGERSSGDAARHDEGFLLVTSVLRRAGRVEVAREMTLKILQLRSDQAASGGRWPAKLVEPTSTVCPGEFYSYSAGKAGVVLRFEGPIDRPPTTPVLPLCFRASAFEPSAAAALTAPDPGGMMAPR